MLEKVKDPRTRKEVLFATGIVKGIFFNKLSEVKTYTYDGKAWTPTHSVSIIVDDTRISYGLTDKEKLNAKDADGKYHEIVKGMEVTVEITEQGEYKGKPSYDSKSSKTTIINSVPKDSPKEDGKYKGEYDDTPLAAGNARTAAVNWVYRGIADISNIKEVVKDFAEVSHSVREKVINNGMSSRDVGFGVGQATIAASFLCNKFSEVEKFIVNYVEALIPASIETVKNIKDGKKALRSACEAPKQAAKPLKEKDNVPQKPETKEADSAVSGSIEPDIPDISDVIDDDSQLPF